MENKYIIAHVVDRGGLARHFSVDRVYFNIRSALISFMGSFSDKAIVDKVKYYLFYGSVSRANLILCADSLPFVDDNIRLPSNVFIV